MAESCVLMKAEEAREKIEALGVEFSSDSFFRSLRNGDREMVELFLVAGLSPDIRDQECNAAILVASRCGHIEIGRLLLARGASPDPLLAQWPKGKDKWDKMTSSSAVLSFISSLLIAAVGGCFTFLYNQRQTEVSRLQAERDSLTKEQANKELELETIQKFIPMLTSEDEQQKAAALVAIQDLAHPELAAHLAVLFRGQGSVQYLEEADASTNPGAQEIAHKALSTIAVSGNSPDSQRASEWLLGNARSVVQNYYTWRDPHFVEAYAQLPNLQERLKALQTAVRSAQDAHPGQSPAQFADCLTNLDVAAFDVSNALKTKAVAQYGNLQALLPAGSNDLQSAQDACVGELNGQLKDARISGAWTAVDAARAALAADFHAIDDKQAAARAARWVADRKSLILRGGTIPLPE